MRICLALLLLVMTGVMPAQGPVAGGLGPPPPPDIQPAAAAANSATPGAQGPGFSLSFNSGDGEQSLGTALEIMLLMTLLAMAPALVMTMTSFTRIVVVLSFLKRAMSMQDLPPALITTGFAVFMTIFIMKPVASDIYDQAYLPYVENRIPWQEAAAVASSRMNKFMLSQTREDDVALILELSRTPRPQTALDTPFHITVPAFVLSEIKTAFQMGFVLFLPFVVIDLVISAILVSMGMFTLPPVVVSTPLKLLLFILVGGWDLVVASLAQSFAA
ncbi:MAG: flagellar type III secretion system pore protein FliP [Planctomycetes bacterium]|nr:flagellar type III secretion system pore protein FliP [Planctomycetota bacterium]